jgi:hypothetical protein
MNSNNSLSFSKDGTGVVGRAESAPGSSGDDCKSPRCDLDVGELKSGSSVDSASCADPLRPSLSSTAEVCQCCGTAAPAAKFSLHKSGDKTYRNRTCNRCRSKRQLHSASTAAKQARVLQAKAAPCACCGQSFEPECMELGHRVGTTKLANIGSAVYWFSMDKLVLELAKCEVLCACCVKLSAEHRVGRKLADVPRADAAAELAPRSSA